MKTDLVVAGYIINDGRVLLIHHKKLDMWLPPGGHIEKDETPDGTLRREIKEETRLDIVLLNMSDLPPLGNTKCTLAHPFHVNVHSVGDHEHCCLFYACKARNPNYLEINKELKAFKWFAKEELNEKDVPPDVREHARYALEKFG